MTKATIGVVITDGRAKRKTIRAKLVDVLASDESMLPREFHQFRSSVSKSLKIFDETIKAHDLDSDRSAKK